MSFENEIVFSKYVRDKLQSSLNNNDQNDIYQEANRLGIKEKAIYILTELLFTENILEEISLENLLSKNEQLYSKSISIFKKFYDDEILDEQIIIDYNFDEHLHRKVATFIHWLVEASSESSESD